MNEWFYLYSTLWTVNLSDLVNDKLKLMNGFIFTMLCGELI